MQAAQLAEATITDDSFELAEKLMFDLRSDLQSKGSMGKQHFDIDIDIESEIAEQLREMARLLLQGHLNARGDGSVGPYVEGSDGTQRTHKRMGEQTIKSIFGEVVNQHLGYGRPHSESLFPKDANLNLPKDSYSHGLHKKIAKEAVRGSIDEAIESVADQTGVIIPKRQALKIIQNASCDFDTFYGHDDSLNTEEKLNTAPIQVLTTDGKGVVMRIEGLREATREKRLEGAEVAAKSGIRELKRGEKKNGKRMAQVASTYCIERYIRTPEDIIREYGSNKIEDPLDLLNKKKPENKRPKPIAKRVWASLEKEQNAVIEDLFKEGIRRDPEKKKEWCATKAPLYSRLKVPSRKC